MKKLIFLLFLLSTQVASAAWSLPTNAPPNGNPDTPVNTGPTAQTKSGDLVVATKFTTNDIWTNLFRLTTGAGLGKVLQSNATGDATWVATSTLGLGGASSGQWTTLGNNIYNNNTGNVGIGTASPGALLTVGSNSGTSNGEIILAKASGVPNRAFKMGLDSNYNFSLGDYGAGGGPYSPYLTINYTNGNVGIGVNPSTKLDVVPGSTVSFPSPGGGSNTFFNLSNTQNYIRGNTVIADFPANQQVAIGTVNFRPGYVLTAIPPYGSQVQVVNGIYGEGRSAGITGVGAPAAPGSVGVYGYGQAYDFYANGGGVNYGPFTGGHEVKLSDDFPLNARSGLLMSVTGENQIRQDEKGISISSTLPTVTISNKMNDTSVLGALVNITPLPDGHWYSPKANERFGTVNALGDGRAWVTNLNGPIKVGDYLTTSPIPGYGQKQNDDILHSYTLGKVTESVDWDKVTETIIFNGQSYKTYLIGLVYTSG